jgi:2-iminobutanoate/2-iminopropanoate deaminase
MNRARRVYYVLTLTLILILSACAAPRTVTRDVIAPPGASRLAPYSPAIRVGDLLFLSGQIGLRPGTRELAAGGVSGETQQALENVRTVLTAAGVTADDVVKCTVFLADMGDYEAMNAVYAGFFTADPPARSAVGVNGLPLGARVEIECIARAGT